MNAKVINGEQTIIIRDPDSIYLSERAVDNGSLRGRWHFSYGDYHHRDYTHFGSLRLLNDETLSPGASLPAHPHRNVEVVTCCVTGELRVEHAGSTGADGGCGDDDVSGMHGGTVLRQGWVQHVTAGRGLCQAEANNLPDEPSRFIRMWFLPSAADLDPVKETRRVERRQRANRFLPLASDSAEGALHIASDATVYACCLGRGRMSTYEIGTGRGLYLYVVEGGPVLLNGTAMPALAAAKVIGGDEIGVRADDDAELLLVDVPLAFDPRTC